MGPKMQETASPKIKLWLIVYYHMNCGDVNLAMAMIQSMCMMALGQKAVSVGQPTINPSLNQSLMS